MKLSIVFEHHEVEAVRTIVEAKLANKRRFVQERFQRNVAGHLPVIDDDRLWKTLIMCLLTTQQRSGPGSPINQLLDQKPFPLALATCQKTLALQEFVLQLLTDTTGIRRTNKIAQAVDRNLRTLENGGWDYIRRWRDQLLVQRASPADLSHRELEEAAAHYVDQFVEFGPKQSCNFWQSLGLTRYVFVLDSRIIGWLRQNLSLEAGLLTASGLGDPQYYRR